MYNHQFIEPLAAARFTCCSSLIEAARSGNTRDVHSFLVWHGGDPNKQDLDGKSAVHHACNKGHIDAVRILVVDHQGDVSLQDNQGKTPLHYAAMQGHTRVCRLLIEQGALLYLLDNDGKTAVDLAREQGHDTLADTLDIAQQNQLADLQSSFLDVVSSDAAQIISDFAGHKWQHAPAVRKPLPKASPNTRNWCSCLFCCN